MILKLINKYFRFSALISNTSNNNIYNTLEQNFLRSSRDLKNKNQRIFYYLSIQIQIWMDKDPQICREEVRVLSLQFSPTDCFQNQYHKFIIIAAPYYVLLYFIEQMVSTLQHSILLLLKESLVYLSTFIFQFKFRSFCQQPLLIHNYLFALSLPFRSIYLRLSYGILSGGS